MPAHADSLSSQPSPPPRLQGYLLTNFHDNYWLGLRAKTWPVFDWLDPFTPGPFASSYLHWGTFLPDNQPEPYSHNGTVQNCAVANASEAYGNGTLYSPTRRAWGWADQWCSELHVVLCRLLGGCPPGPLGPWRLCCWL